MRANYEERLTKRLQKHYPHSFGRLFSEGNRVIDNMNLMDIAARLELAEVQRKWTKVLTWATIIIAVATIAQVIIAICKC